MSNIKLYWGQRGESAADEKWSAVGKFEVPVARNSAVSFDSLEIQADFLNS